MKPIDVAVIGCGRMGAHHARIIGRDPRSRLVAIVDREPARVEVLAQRLGVEVRDRVPDGVEAVVVATPTATHAEIATRHLDAGRWVLVEKPFTCTSAEAEALDRPRCAVGHVERFNPAVRAAGNVSPRFVDARRLVPFTGRVADVCVVKDLMVHDLDLVLTWSVGEIASVEANGLCVRSNDLDVASATIRTSDGIVANLLASRIAAVPERSMRIYEERRTTLLDLLGREARRGSTPLVAPDKRDGLTAQWDAFVDAIAGEAPIAVPAREGWRVVALAERIRDVMRRGDAELERAGRRPGWAARA